MIADTTFLSDIHDEYRDGIVGPARRFIAENRGRGPVRTTVINVGEIAVIFDSNEDARQFLSRYKVYKLDEAIAYVAAQIEREVDQRLGENDNWVAAFGRYYHEPVISRDPAFRRVRHLRVLTY